MAEQNDGRFPDESDVLVRYPAPGMTGETPREDWPWMTGIIEVQCGPDEWCVTVTDRRLARLEDITTPAPDGTPEEDLWYPQCFRDSSELKRPEPEVPKCRHCGAPVRRCDHAGANTADYPLCKGWRHVGYEDQPVIGHCCGGRSINPAAEPKEEVSGG